MDKFPKTGGYGWTDLSPEILQARLLRAAEEFLPFFEEVGADAIAFTGSSGAAIAFTLAGKYRIPLVYVRKEGEKSHGSEIESNGVFSRYIIVDDFICLGVTMDRVGSRIEQRARYYNCAAECVGVFLFDSTRSKKRTNFTFSSTDESKGRTVPVHHVSASYSDDLDYIERKLTAPTSLLKKLMRWCGIA